MSEVIFKFDAIEEANEVKFIADRYKVMNALEELSNLRRSIYKGFYSESDYCLVLEDIVESTNWTGEKYKVRKAVKLVTQEDIEKACENNKLCVEGAVAYLSSEWVEKRINEILDQVAHLLE